MVESVYDWEIFFRKNQFFHPKNVSQSKNSIKFNKKLGLPQTTINNAISNWRKKNLGE